MSINNDVVIIELDRPREVRFGHKALKTLYAMTGKDVDALMGEENLDLDDLEKIMYCGLLSDARAHNETLTIESMEDLLDQAPSFEHVMKKMMEAFEKSFGSMKGNAESGNEIPQSKMAHSTGKNL